MSNCRTGWRVKPIIGKTVKLKPSVLDGDVEKVRAINLLLCLDVALGSLPIVCREQLCFFQWRTARLRFVTVATRLVRDETEVKCLHA